MSGSKRVLRRILIVEDDPDIEEVTGLLLSALGEAAMRIASLANANGSPTPGPVDSLLKLVATLSTALPAVVHDRAADSRLRAL